MKVLPALSVRLFGSISYINMYDNHYSHFFLDMLISFCGVFAVFVFIQCFRIPKPVSWFGRSTMFYYAFHIPMFTLLWSVTQRITALSDILSGNGTHALVMIRCLITLADVVALAPLCLLTNRFIPFLVGEKSRKNRCLPAADVAGHE